MLTLLASAEALRDDGDFVRQQIQYLLDQSKNPDELVLGLWDLIKPNPALQPALVNIQVERLHFQRVGKTNATAQARRLRQAQGFASGQPTVRPNSIAKPSLAPAALSTLLPTVKLPNSDGTVPSQESALFGAAAMELENEN
jgi:hypothetical protein